MFPVLCGLMWMSIINLLTPRLGFFMHHTIQAHHPLKKMLAMSEVQHQYCTTKYSSRHLKSLDNFSDQKESYSCKLSQRTSCATIVLLMYSTALQQHGDGIYTDEENAAVLDKRACYRRYFQKYRPISGLLIVIYCMSLWYQTTPVPVVWL